LAVAELQTQLEIAHEVGYLDDKALTELESTCHDRPTLVEM